MTEILLIRHAQTTWNVEGRVQGHTDVPLNETGHRMAAALADWLARDAVDAVYSSDLRRAWQTAEAVAGRHALTVTLDDRLRECRIATPYPTDEFIVLPFGVERETEACVVGRMVECLGDIAARHQGQRVVVISHGGAIKRFLRQVLGEVPPPPAGQSTNTAIHHLLHDGDAWRALRLHGCAHLEKVADVAGGVDAG